MAQCFNPLMNAVLIIDKPAGLTSHDVVNRVRRILHERSVGHLGTLDPMATGVLPLVVGNLTRLAQFYTHAEKVYEGTIRFGFSTDTYDAEGEPTSTPQTAILHAPAVETLAARFRGVIEQVPPPFSAKKIHGVPAYKLARKQKEVVLKPVQVEIKEFEFVSVEEDRARFRARVASGTYMRSVAHEMGQLLGCGAHLASLRRTVVAEFKIEDAHTLEELADIASGCHSDTNSCHPDRSLPFLKEKASGVEGPAVALASSREIPSVSADEAAAARIRSGRTVNLPELSRAKQVKVFYGQRELLAIATRVAGTLFHPKIVLCGQEVTFSSH
jgi:tRNA pseudouridine55 synthase